MENVLDLYHLSHDPQIPLICMDESSKQLIGELQAPIAAAPGHPQLIDDEYIRNGVAEIFLEIQPHTGRRHVEITQRRAAVDWAHFIRGMLQQRYPHVAKVRLVCDNLNTHAISSLYQAFPASEARALAQRLEIHHTPKHGSWLNIAEIELSALKGQCLARRIPEIEQMRQEVGAWQTHRNNRAHPIDWQFRTCDARVKLKYLYPKN